MQKITRVSLLGLAIAVLALSGPSALGGDMKPYKGWILFPPTFTPEGVAIAQYWDNIGGRAIRVAPTTWDLPYPVGNTWVMTAHQQGIVTFPNGDQLFDVCTVTLVLNATGTVLLGGSLEATITGGTGRFLGAYGSASLAEGTIDLPAPYPMAAGSLRVWFEGEICTVGSLRQAQ